ncbi:MAG: hypothetical protein ABJG68_09180 [Crocinitomicaceae bacterium]
MIYLLVIASEYILNQHLGWLSNYATDICCMPIVLSILWFLLVRFSSKYNKLPWSFILFMTTLWTLYFELYLPTLSANYTSDYLDGICYFVGAASFLIFQNYAVNEKLDFKFN